MNSEDGRHTAPSDDIDDTRQGTQSLQQTVNSEDGRHTAPSDGINDTRQGAQSLQQTVNSEDGRHTAPSDGIDDTRQGTQSLQQTVTVENKNSGLAMRCTLKVKDNQKPIAFLASSFGKRTNDFPEHLYRLLGSLSHNTLHIPFRSIPKYVIVYKIVNENGNSPSLTLPALLLIDEVNTLNK